MPDAVLALGSNLGDSAETLQSAVEALRAVSGVDVVGVSGVVETDPVGGPEQDVYLNAVVLVRTDLSPEDLLDVTQRVENEFGRVRDIRWGPRTLDVDIITYDDVVSDDTDLTLPHPRAHERGFVLVPWLDADPQASLPGHGAVRDLVGSVDVSGVRATDLVLSMGGPDR